MMSAKNQMACAAALLTTLAAPAAFAQEDGSDEVRPFRLRLSSEFGLVDVVTHTFQQGEQGTNFDYVTDGDDELFRPYLRVSAEAEFNERHTAYFLYQPIRFEGFTLLPRDIVMDEATFAEGDAIDWVYGFDFFRASYTYDLFAGDELDLQLGGGFQMRIAEIGFERRSDGLTRVARDLGPVPLLKARVRYQPGGSKWWFASEIDGFYASVPIVNGSIDTTVTGGFLDASVRVGHSLRPGLDGFFNIRYIGGGGEGTSPSDADRYPGDGYSSNWINTVAISLGFVLDPGAIEL